MPEGDETLYLRLRVYYDHNSLLYILAGYRVDDHP